MSSHGNFAYDTWPIGACDWCGDLMYSRFLRSVCDRCDIQRHGHNCIFCRATDFLHLLIVYKKESEVLVVCYQCLEYVYNELDKYGHA